VNANIARLILGIVVVIALALTAAWFAGVMR
jgi:hypothetical protein